MASIKIKSNKKNQAIAERITGATVTESDGWLTVTQAGRLFIPSTDRTLILNRDGWLETADGSGFVIVDRDSIPQTDRVSFLFRFPSAAARAEAQDWADRAGYRSLGDYVLDAIDQLNQRLADMSIPPAG